MAITFVDYTATAAQTDFAFSFPYLEDEHVTVTIDGVATTGFTIVTSPSTKIVLDSGATAGEIVRVQRISAPDENLVDFVNGSVLTESELDRAYLHNRYLAEESAEQNDISLRVKTGATGSFDALNKKIVNVSDPTADQDAATKNYVDDTVAGVVGGSIPDDSVTYAKLQNAAGNNVLLGNDNGADSDIQELNATEAKTLLGLSTVATSGSYNDLSDKPSIGTGTVTSVDSGTGLTGGPITTSGTLSIADNGVTFAKMQDINTAKVIGRTTAGSGDPEEVSILDEDAMTSNSATALATQQSIKAYVDSQVVSKYTAAWATSHGGVTVANGATLSITHNLGTSDVIVQAYVNSSASDVGALSLDSTHEDDSGFTPGQGAVVTSIQSANAITVQLGTNGYYSWNSSGVMSGATFASKYIKVVVIG